MIERVALVLFKEETGGDYRGPAASLLDDEAMNVHRETARAILQVMREPTEAIGRINGSRNWPAMIDAAIDEKSPAGAKPTGQGSGGNASGL